MESTPVTRDGDECWVLPDGTYHREDGPAFISRNGAMEWLHYGKTHREDGPAVIWANGRVHWYLNNHQIRSAKKFQEELGLSDEDMTALLLKYGNIR